MDWILANLKLVAFAIIIVVYLFKAMRGKAEADSQRPNARPTTAAGADAAEAERTRQIQEEIRRRILARQRGEMPQPAAQPPIVVVAPPPVPEFEPEEMEVPEGGWGRHGPPQPPPQVVPVPAASYSSSGDASILEAQRALEEQYAMVRRMRDVASAGIPTLSATKPYGGGLQQLTVSQSALRHDLKDPRTLRRAILLREILGEPIAMRTGQLPRR